MGKGMLQVGGWALVGLCGLLFIAAAPASPVIRVTEVRFDQKRLPGQSYPWAQISIGLRPSGSSVPQQVQLRLWVVYQVGATQRAYLGHTQLYALSDPATVRFYLPPDVLRAERLPQSPSGYYLEISSSAGAESYDRAHGSPLMSNPAERAKLKALPTQPLLAHPDTPFYSQPDTWRELPAYAQ